MSILKSIHIHLRFRGLPFFLTTLLLAGLAWPATAQDATIFAYKFHDQNCNSVWDGSEPVLPNWTIYLDLNNNGQQDAGEPVNTTDGTGLAHFQVPAGTYSVAEVVPSGWKPIVPAAGRQTITLGPGEAADVIFGNIETGSVSGEKFEDINGNGQKGAGEPTLPGWEITLTGQTCAGDPVTLPVTTDADGRYSLDDLLPGSYLVQETQQEGFEQTYPDGDGTHTFDLAGGQQHTDVDFGNQREQPLGSIHGLKFHDLNGDGIMQDNEPRLAGWTIFLDLNANGEHDAATEPQFITLQDDPNTPENEEGWYWFDDLPPGTYRVREIMQQEDGWVQSYPLETDYHLVEVPGGGRVNEVDFGNYQLGEIPGVKFNDLDKDGALNTDEPGLEGWQIKLEGADNQGFLVKLEAETDETGKYCLKNVPPGTYTLSEVQQGNWTQTFPGGSGTHTVTVTSGQRCEDPELQQYNFGNHDAPADYGDAPDSYATRRESDGARHIVVPGFHLGARIDDEDDGEPTANALGDDTDVQGDDEDGVSTYRAMVPGDVILFTFLPTDDGFMDAWADYNNDGIFDDSTKANDDVEYIFQRRAIGTLNTAISYAVPGVDIPDLLYTRFRFSKTGGLKPTGLAIDGEVEDYVLGSYHGQLYEDPNGNGMKDSTERVVAGAVIKLRRIDLIDAYSLVQTDAEGRYAFKGLFPGTYEAEVVELPAGWQFPDGAVVEQVAELEAGLVVRKIDFTPEVVPIPDVLDYGDAPDSYKTRGPDGPRHGVVNGYHLGDGVDADADGQPTPNADGDDTDADGDDEGGFSTNKPLMPGTTVEFVFVPTGKGVIDAWADFDASGTFDDKDGPDLKEQIIDGAGVEAMFANLVQVTVPDDVPDKLYLRVRFSSQGGLSPIGTALDGEVEDHVLGSIHGFKFEDLNGNGQSDFGEPGLADWTIQLQRTDRMAASVTTKTDADGAYAFKGVFEGEYTLSEMLPGGWHQSMPDGNGTHTLTLVPGQVVKDIDFGNWLPGAIHGMKFNDVDADSTKDAGEPGLAGWTIKLKGTDGKGNLVDSTVTTRADGTYTFDNLPPGTYEVREVPQFGWQQTMPAGRTYTVTLESGQEVDGRDFGNREVSGQVLDFGDAPASYKTLRAHNGAAHVVVEGVHLGDGVDVDDDGQPGGVALGDDNDADGDDERGISANKPLHAGEVVLFSFAPSVDGFIDAWADYNGNGTFDADERLFDRQPLSAGSSSNAISRTLPDVIMPDVLYVRLRFSTEGVFDPVGPANDGEVEDFALGSIHGVLFEDINDDGEPQDTEPRLDGWTVHLRSADDYEIIVETTTHDGGHYSFTGVWAGDYEITVVVEEGQPWGLLPGQDASVSLAPGQVLDNRGIIAVGVEEDPLAEKPSQFHLHQNYPNPFNPRTTLGFDVKAPAHVVLKVFNLTGQEVATLVDEHLVPGRYRTSFEASGLPSGVYYYRIEMGGFQDVRAMVVLK